MENTKKNFLISTDETCDLPIEVLQERDISFKKMVYFVDNIEYNCDGSPALDTKTFYDYMRSGKSTKTSQVNEYEAEEYFKELLKRGKDILHIAFASKMSGSCANFQAVAAQLNAVNEHKIYVVDSLAESGGEGLIVTLVDDFARTGATIEQAVEYAEAVKHRVCHYFVVDDLKYLARGGRISKSSAVIGNIIHIKPVLHTDFVGALMPIKKVINRKKSLSELVEYFSRKYNEESKIVYITHGDCLEDAQFVSSLLMNKHGISSQIFPLTPIIGSHSGPGTVALFFTSADRSK